MYESLFWIQAFVPRNKFVVPQREPNQESEGIKDLPRGDTSPFLRFGMVPGTGEGSGVVMPTFRRSKKIGFG